MFKQSIPEGGLLGRPLRGTFRLHVLPAKRGEENAIPIAEYLKTAQVEEPVMPHWSPLDGQEHPITVPDGSLKAHIEKRAAEFSDPDAHVIIHVEYLPAPGEDIGFPPDRLTKGDFYLYGGSKLPPGLTPADVMKRHR